MTEVLDANDVRMATPFARQPSPLARTISAMDPRTSDIPMHSHQANASQSTSRSLSQQPLLMPLPTKDEASVPEAIPISTPIRSESPCRPFEPEHSCKRELPASEQTMMDVDEELLSLVEDRPLSVVPAAVKMQIDPSSMADQGTDASPEEGSSEAAAGSLSSQLIIKGPLLIADEEKDRASMPPPAARGKKGEKTISVAGPATASKKKKDGTSRAAAKPKQPLKPRAKPVPKPKVKPTPVDTSSKASIPRNSVTVDARSRSTSAIPGPVDDIVPEPEAEDGDKEDDKLYCVCKTRYDEDRTMIACDRCDEWFHTQCVGMPELEIDLVDQFICPPCIQKYPHLRTTWKQRCLFGRQHENPLSLEACHRPARGAFSKYCSDECGIKYMRSRITQWEASGGARDLLWENVKNAAKREGVVVHAETNKASPRKMDGENVAPKLFDLAAKRRAEREVTRLNARLDEVVKEREFMKRELDMVVWREKVVELASERAGKVDECGWDQRLCFGEEEWADFGSEVLESYEEERTKMDSVEDSMALDASVYNGCWQKLRVAEVSFDKETKEGILLKLTTREREIRKRIEDILFPQPTGTLQASTKRPHPEVQLNGSEKPIGHVSERGKKT
ncbi:hypothetical protein JVU11DRAFT_5195 [Chiua virens]|nr:hypothetical protein JVU11DRAFT_5195 [Chiua virens]